MTTQATQLTITIPDGVPPGSILSIPIKGGSETIKARVPEGLGAGSTLVLTKHEGTDNWVEEIGDVVSPVGGGAAASSVSQHSDGNNSFVEPLAPEVFSAPQQTQPQPPQPPAHGSVQLPPGVPEPEVVEGPVAYTVRLDTTAGVIDIIVRPDWAPHGARRFLDLAAAGDLDDLAFYRSVKGCLAQFGLPPRRQWPPLPDDPPTGVPFLLGAVCFAAVGPNTRKSTLFICIGDMSHCFGQQPWETPIGAVTESSLDVLDRLETIYGDIAECGGSGPDASRIHTEGNAYLRTNFPLLTYIRHAAPLDWEPAEGNATVLPPMKAELNAGGPKGPPRSAQPSMTPPMPCPHASPPPQGCGPSASQLVDVPVEVKASPGQRHVPAEPLQSTMTSMYRCPVGPPTSTMPGAPTGPGNVSPRSRSQPSRLGAQVARLRNSGGDATPGPPGQPPKIRPPPPGYGPHGPPMQIGSMQLPIGGPPPYGGQSPPLLPQQQPQHAMMGYSEQGYGGPPPHPSQQKVPSYTPPPGQPGPHGPQGPHGQQGPYGPQGPHGMNGLHGPPAGMMSPMHPGMQPPPQQQQQQPGMPPMHPGMQMQSGMPQGPCLPQQGGPCMQPGMMQPPLPPQAMQPGMQQQHSQLQLGMPSFSPPAAMQMPGPGPGPPAPGQGLGGPCPGGMGGWGPSPFGGGPPPGGCPPPGGGMLQGGGLMPPPLLQVPGLGPPGGPW